ncbi:hypothetical protein RD792_000397 [Penstemon davidsonii]|uniref:Protein yippee-like n=1 Tax=Penstemon davidsonii TaxID=160366 RepID=A0ABR0DLB2_9LAMI|nr:hypothetical protein RD792_000397 [Penstemon davidsonii]
MAGRLTGSLSDPVLKTLASPKRSPFIRSNTDPLAELRCRGGLGSSVPGRRWPAVAWVLRSQATGGANSGQAYMFAHAMNIVIGPKVDKKLITGYYSVAEIFCSKCGVEMGWTYVRAYDAKQKFKVGNYVLEKAKILKEY